MGKEHAMIEERRYRYVLERLFKNSKEWWQKEFLKNMDLYFSIVDECMKDISCMKKGDILYRRLEDERFLTNLSNLKEDMYGPSNGNRCLVFTPVKFVTIVDEDMGIVKIKQDKKEEQIDACHLWVERTGLKFFNVTRLESLEYKGYLSAENTPISFWFSDIAGVGYIEEDLKIPNFKFQIYYNVDSREFEIGIDIKEEYFETAKRELQEERWKVRLRRAIIKRAQNIGDIAMIRLIFNKIDYSEFKEGKFCIKQDIIVPKQSFAGNPYIEYLLSYYIRNGVKDIQEVEKYYGKGSYTALFYDYAKLDKCIYFERDILPLYPKALLNKGWDKNSEEVKLFS